MNAQSTADRLMRYLSRLAKDSVLDPIPEPGSVGMVFSSWHVLTIDGHGCYIRFGEGGFYVRGTENREWHYGLPGASKGRTVVQWLIHAVTVRPVISGGQPLADPEKVEAERRGQARRAEEEATRKAAGDACNAKNYELFRGILEAHGLWNREGVRFVPSSTTPESARLHLELDVSPLALTALLDLLSEHSYLTTTPRKKS